MKRWIFPLGIGVSSLIVAIVVFFPQSQKNPQPRQQEAPRYVPVTRLQGDLYYVTQRLWKTHRHPSIASRKTGWVQLPEISDDSREHRQQRAPDAAQYIGPGACAECHQEKYDGYIQTAHYLTSRLPGEESILGNFADGKNILRTSDDRLWFEMEARGDDSYQTALLRRDKQVYAHSKRIDLVTGSGNHGQTYLYWGEDDRLYELPVSYFKKSNRWINSPGYKDGTADFARPILPRCLECHTTFFDYIAYSKNKFVRDNFILSISCEKCHGPGSKHVAYQRENPNDDEARFITHPGELERDRLNEVCAQCHSAAHKLLKSPFSFRPGQQLDKYMTLDHSKTEARQGVHSFNQLSRLLKSRCFTESPELTCATCHDPHRNEHAQWKIFSKRCLQCHQTQQCGECVKQGGETGSHNCIDCHMPTELDSQIDLDIGGGESEFPLMRDHFIRVVRDN